MVSPNGLPLPLYSMDLESQTWVENVEDEIKDDPVYEDDGDKDDPVLPTINEDNELMDTEDDVIDDPPSLIRYNALYTPHPHHLLPQWW